MSNGDESENKIGESKSGRCCACGTEEPEESPCPASPDGIHCNHWWDGPETPEKKSTGSAGTEGEDKPRGDWNEIEAFTAARRLMRERLEKDEGLRIGYRSNIAMLLDDELDLGHDKRNELAERLIKLIFGEG